MKALIEALSPGKKQIEASLRELVENLGRYWKEGLVNALPHDADAATVKWAKGFCARYWKKIK